MAGPTHIIYNIISYRSYSRSINDVIITELESTLALSDHSFIECNLNMPISQILLLRNFDSVS